MNISTFSRYGLRAVIRLALLQEDGDKPVSVKKIAEDENISMKYLENIFSMLRKHNVVMAVRGKFGGYRLSVPAETITVFSIIEALEGRIAPTSCVYNQAECSNNPALCSAFPLWVELNATIESILKNKYLSDMIRDFKVVQCKSEAEKKK